MAAFLDFYGLSFNPFDKQCVREKDAFESNDFKEMTSRLERLKSVRGIGLFTSRPGMGKTFALRCFSKELNPNQYKMEYICLSTVSICEFYRQLCEILGVSSKGGKPGRFSAIQEQIYHLYKEKRQPLFLAVDEAQFLNTAILNDIKMLMNHNYDSLNCFTLILCGEPHLNNILRKSVHEALRQRIMVHYDFAGLNEEEVPQYIRHKLSSAGGAPSIIAESGMASINSFSQGNPRIIDNIMSDALTIGAQINSKVIDADVILSAANNQNLT